MRSRRKFFKVEWIPEAAGRQLVREFSLLVRSYRDQKTRLRLTEMSLMFDSKGDPCLYLYFGDGDEVTDPRPDEQDPDPTSETGRVE